MMLDRHPSALNNRELRNAFGCFPTGVAIVTCMDAGQRVAVTVNSLTSVSLSPPMLLFSLHARSSCLGMVAKAGGFCVSVLSAKQQELSNRFSLPSKVDWREIKTISPGPDRIAMADAVATFSCRRWGEHIAGDHVVFFGEIEAFEYDPHIAPLSYSRGRYGSFAPNPSKGHSDDALTSAVDFGGFGWG